MTTPTFKYVEDYIEFIAGHRDVSGKIFGMFDTKPTPINLARYDVSIIDSFAEQTNWSTKAFTDKQAELAVRLVFKYQRQLGQLTPAVILPDTLDQFRLGIRVVDRSKKVYLNDGKIHVRFPYDTKLIETVKKQNKIGQGSANFNADSKEWELGLTEDMINWAVTIGQANGFDIDDHVLEFYNKILDREKEEYKIELVKTDTGFEITNAAQSLIDYINEHHGGFGADNLMQLVDASEVLGYTVAKPLYDELFNQFPTALGLMLSRRKHTFKADKVSMEHVLDYARKVNRLPIHVYETGLPKPDTEEIIYLNRNADANVVPKLLVSKTSLMVGTKKQAWIANAEKIFILE